MSAGCPEWLDELDTRLATNPQLVLVGAPNEQHLVPNIRRTGYVWQNSANVVTGALTRAGYALVVQWSIEDGLRLLHESTEGLAEKLLSGFGGSDARREEVGGDAASLVGAMRQIRGFTATGSGVEGRAALLVSGAERLAETPASTPLREIFALAQHNALVAKPQPSGGGRGPLFNVVVWMVAREQDLPPWFVSTRGVQVLSVPLPDMQTRRMVARSVLTKFSGAAALTDDQRARRAMKLADLCEAMTQAQMLEVGRFASDRGMDVDHLDDAVRGTRSGLRESPWRTAELRLRIRGAAEILLGQREPAPDDMVQPVLGQPEVVRKAIDVINRSALGLSDWDERTQSARPQGILFLAGPTGVGKTYLAKQLATAVFGVEDAMIRFDMSEYSTSQSEARFIGSPPGYVGYESGGQLTNAVRARPFSLLLFDEIDKAHPLVLDKFLQILEDGRLTDGSGSTIHFGESLIVFTSNLGVYQRGDSDTDSREPLVLPGDDYADVESKVRAEIDRYFKQVLKRPEILNRIGDNILVFGYLSAQTAIDLLHVKLRTLAASVRERQSVQLDLQPAAVKQLESLVVRPEHIQFGGRGVKNLLESRVVNPLGRELLQCGPGTFLTVLALTSDGLDAVRT